MQNKTSARIAGLFALAFAVFVAVANTDMMNVCAAENSEKTDEINNYQYNDVNSLGATVTIKNTILKVKKNNAAQTPRPSKVTVNGKTLKLNRDYTVLYQFLGDEYDEIHESWKTVENLTVPGLYRICLKGIGEYNGVYTRRIYVYDPKNRVPVSAFKVTVNKVPYTGKAITDGVIKSIKYKNKELVENKDYYVEYLSNVDSGTGIVRISAVEGSGFTGERDVKFTITGGTKISKVKITGITAKTYDCGKAVIQDMSQVKLTFKDKELVQDTDYVVSYYMNNNKAGTAKIVIAGKGSYYGTVTKSFKIGKVKLSADMLDEASRYIVETYTKKAVKPEVTLCNSNGDKLVKGTDYTLSYKSNKKISDKAVITVKGKGNYTGSFKVYFTIKDKTNEPGTDETEESSESGETDESKVTEPESTEVPEVTEPEPTKPSDGTETGESSESGESAASGESESAGSESEEESKEARPGSRVCWCGYTVNISDFNNITNFEISDWKAHVYGHTRNGESTGYTDQYSDGTEIEGVWTWNTETGDEPETAKSGTRVCHCGFTLDIRDFDNLTIDEIQIWNGHAKPHVESGGNWKYTDKYSDGMEVERSGSLVADPAVTKPIGFLHCACGRIMPIFVYGGSDEEMDVWNAHSVEDNANGRPYNYNGLSYETALKYNRFTEDTVFIPLTFYVVGEDGFYVPVED